MSDILDVPTGEMDGLLGYFERNGLSWGAADLAAVGSAGVLPRIGEVAALLMTGFRDQDDRPMVGEVMIVLPPLFDIDDATVKADVAQAMESEICRLAGKPAPPPYLNAMVGRLRVLRADDLTEAGLAGLIGRAKARTAVLVLEAALYRGGAVTPGATGDRLREDIWVGHLTSLAAACVAAAETSETYVFLDAGEYAPSRPENLTRLCSVLRCGVVTAEGEGPDEVEVAANAQRWLRMAQEGRLGAALKEVEGVDLQPNRRTFLELHLYNAAGLNDHVRAQLLAHPELLADLPASGAVHVAEIAEAADADHIARDLLRHAIDDLQNQEQLETGLRLAARIQDPPLADAYAAKLERFFPASAGLRHRRVRRLLDEGRLGEAGAIARENGRHVEAPDLYEFLGEEFSKAIPRIPNEILAEVGARFPTLIDEARLLLAAHLERNGQRREALELLLTPGPEPQAAFVWSSLQILERGLLLEAEDIDDDLVVEVIRASARYLGANISDGPVRVKLTRILRPQLLGARANPMMLLLLVQALREQVGVRPGRPLHERALAAEPEAVLEAMRVVAAWLQEEGVAILGSRTFPRDQLALDPDELLAGLSMIIQQLAGRLEDEGDHKTLDLCLVVVAAIAPLAADPNKDLALLRLAANVMAVAGHGQRSRDLAEQMLRLAGDSPERRRIAWFGFGDIYARLRNGQEAMLGLICALAADEAASWEEIWYETSLAFRILRDNGLSLLARPLVESGRRALIGLGALEDFGHRLTSMALQIDFAEYQSGPREAERLQVLIARMADNAREAQGQRDEAVVSASLLANMLLLARRQNIPPPAGAQHLLAELVANSQGRLGTLLEAITSAEPTADQVLGLARLLDRPRYTEDLAFDVRALTIAARRLLDSPEAQEASTIVFATDLLADQAVTLPGEAHAADRTPTLPASVQAPLEQALELSRQGLSVVTLALAEDNLLRVTVTDGAVVGLVREPQDTFSLARFEAWSEHHPYAYGTPPDERNPDLNVFFSTTEGLGITELPERAVLVMSAELQRFPVNLLRIGDDLAGANRALATTPSLAWLTAARTRAPRRAARSVAWIPDAVPVEGLPSLAMISQDLQPTFEAHGFEVTNGLAPPASASGAELVVLAAHGQVVAEEKRFFRSVQDDVSLALTPTTVSDALAQAGVVVLFVCSGGRIDEHPGASTTLGLAKQLLDSGCSTVVAPPWPLYVGVPARWLPTFLEHWSKGRPVIDACFAANAVVRAQLGDTPAWWLAMSVYGDPLVTKAGAPDKPQARADT
jgi:hypothetical protein